MRYNPLPLNTPLAKNSLENRIILVSGASDGIGRQAALSYAQHGAQVLLLGRNQQKLACTQQQITDSGGLHAPCFYLDYAHASTADCRQLAQHIEKQVPRLDGLLHNAGTLGEICPMPQQTAQSWLEVMQVNINTTFFLTQALLPLLLKSQAASLVFTSSSVGRKGRASWGAYSVSKFATEGMMQILADEYQGQNLRINCINPGGTRSKMRTSAFPDENPLLLKTPTDIMPLYLWIMSEVSRPYNGHSFDAQPDVKPGMSTSSPS